MDSAVDIVNGGPNYIQHFHILGIGPNFAKKPVPEMSWFLEIRVTLMYL